MIRSRLVLGAFTFDALAAGLAVDDGRLAAVMEPMEVAGEIEAEPMPDGSRLWRLAGARHG